MVPKEGETGWGDHGHKKTAPHGLDGEEWNDSLGVGAEGPRVWRWGDVCGYGEGLGWPRWPERLEEGWLVYTLAATPEPHDPRGFLTGCLGDRSRNHGAWGFKWLAVPGSCFGV